MVVVLLVGVAFAAQGCLMAGNYHSAKTLKKGETSFGLTFSATTYEFTKSDGMGGTTTGRVAIPNVLPELTYHVGVSDDLEVGGRAGIGSLALEGDVKYRFHKSEKLHLAVAPAIGYQTMIIVQGVTLRLPLILTYDLADNVGFTAAAFVSTTKYSSVDPNDANNELSQFSGTLGSGGGAIGFEIRGETFEIRPAIEFTQWALSFNNDNFDSFNTINILVHLVFIGGREKQQLDRIERKIDNLGGTGEPPPPPPPPARYSGL